MKTDLTLTGRRRASSSHPVFMHEGYLLETDASDAYFEMVSEWVELLKSGLCVTGGSLMGKTRCVKSVMQRLRQEYPSTGLALLSGELDSGRDSEDRFLKVCLEQVGRSSRGYAESVCGRLTHHFIAECQNVGGRVMALFIDEAQALRSAQLNFIRNVWNRMSLEGYALLVFLIGNSSLKDMAGLAHLSGRQDNIGRFFVKFSTFDGVRTVESLERILRQYDDSLWFPTADWPFSRYFAQESYDEGWRLEHEAGPLLGALKEAQGLSVLPHTFAGFCMGPIVKSIHAMFKDALYDSSFHPGKQQIAWLDILERHTAPELLSSAS